MISERAHAECVRLLELLTNKRVQESWSWVFMTPVSGIAGYEQVVKKPMDLGTVKRHLGAKPSRCRFRSHAKFARDVRLVFHNAMLYNKDDRHVKGSVFDAAQHLLRVFETAYTKAVETVFKDEAADDDADHDAASADAKADDKPAEARHHHESDASDDDDGDGGHRKHKKEKKEKKAKKSKKKSKDREKKHSSTSSSGEKKSKSHKSSSRDKDRSKDKHHHHSSSGGGGDSASIAAESALTTSTSGVTASASSDVSAVKAAVATAKDPSSSSAQSVSSGSKSSDAPPQSALAPASSSSRKMSDSEIQACLGVLMKLIKYKEGNISPAAPFLQPVELSHFPDYRVKVPNRMHLYGVQKKLRSGGYPDINAFAYDVRLVFSNCLIYNSDVILSKVMRSHAVTLMKLFEVLFEKIGGRWPGIPERWRCHQILHEILANRTDGQETAQWFKYPIQTYFDSPDQIPYGYYKIIKVPMDISTVSARLHLGEYKHASEFVREVKLIFDNCIRYWKPDPQGQTYCESAKTLTNLLKAQVDQVLGSALGEELHSKDKHKSSSSSSSKSHRPSSASSTSGVAVSSSSMDDKGKRKSSKSSVGSFAEREVCLGILKQLRAHKMKGYRGIDIATAGPFLHAVDTTKYPDYLKIISEPMDFAKIERKLKGDRYGSVDEFSADVHLIFSNCHKYNSDPIEGADIRAMASSLRDYFVELYTSKLSHAVDSGVSTAKSTEAKVSAAAPAPPPSAPVATKVVTTTAPEGRVQVSIPKQEVTSNSTKAKVPSRSPTKKSSSESARESERHQSAPTSSSTSSSSGVGAIKIESSTPAPPTVVKDSQVPHQAPPAPQPAAASKVKVEASSSSSGSKEVLSEADELKRRQERKERKERKEKKKDKKEKKKKDKKDKEKKKKDRKEKSSDDHHRHRSQGSSSSSGHAGTSSAVTAVSAASDAVAPSAQSTAAVPKKSPVVGAAVPLSSPPPLKSSVGSKVSGSELQRASSSSSSSKKSSSKKSSSKKSDLSPWEASCDRVLNRLAKIEQVAKLHFDQPLLEVFPQLQGEYLRLISEPMDLRTLREQLHAHALPSVAEFLRKGRLIFQNAVKFNCASDPASLHVREMSSHLQWYFDSLCAELNLHESASADATSRQKQLRRERGEVVAGVPMDLKPKECLKLLRVLNSQKYDKNCWPFRKPAKVLFPALAPEYFDIIKNPMDLMTISEKVAAFEYKLHGDFIRDVRLTFENAIVYNKADKDREGWSVYAAAVHMLSVAEDLWSDVTLEVTERLRRKDMLRKERERLGEKRKPSGSDKRAEKERARLPVAAAAAAGGGGGGGGGAHSGDSKVLSSGAPSSAVISAKLEKDRSHAVAGASTIASTSAATSSATPSSVLAAATIVAASSGAGGSSASRDGSPDLSRLKLSIVNRSATGSSASSVAGGAPNVDRMNKSERKAEEKRRKRARREEEIARSEKRRRTAVAATDDALREAEERSRRKLQKLEIAQAMKAREEREQKAREAEAERARIAKMKFDAQAWTGVLVPAQQSSHGFWSKKRIKLQLPAVFAAGAEPIGSH